MSTDITTWLKERQPDRQSVAPLKGINTITKQQSKDFTKAITPSFTRANPARFFDPNYSPSVYDANIDYNALNDPEKLLAHRSEEQGAFLKGLNAVAGGLMGGALTAVENFAGLADMIIDLQSFNNDEIRTRNVVSRYTESIRGNLDKALPIYETPGEGALDTFWKFNSLKGMLDSVVGFGLSGGAIAKGTRLMAGLAVRGARLTAFQTTMLNSGSNITSAFLSNLGETSIMNIELYENAREAEIQDRTKDILRDRFNGDYSMVQAAEQLAAQSVDNDPEFARAVGTQQQRFAYYNKLMILPTMFALRNASRVLEPNSSVSPIGLRASVVKSIKDTGTFLRHPVLTTQEAVNLFKTDPKKFLGRLPDSFLLQNLKEAGEEIYQNMIQQEGEYQVRKTMGRSISDAPENTFKRLLQFATSEQALVEGMMGFFSGGLQSWGASKVSHIMSGDPLGRERDKHNKKVEELAEDIERTIKHQAENIINHTTLSADAAQDGDTEAANLLDNTLFQKTALDYIFKGGTQQVREQLEALEKETSDPAKKAAIRERIGEFNKMAEDYAVNLDWLKRNPKLTKGITPEIVALKIVEKQVLYRNLNTYTNEVTKASEEAKQAFVNDNAVINEIVYSHEQKYGATPTDEQLKEYKDKLHSVLDKGSVAEIFNALGIPLILPNDTTTQHKKIHRMATSKELVMGYLKGLHKEITDFNQNPTQTVQAVIDKLQEQNNKEFISWPKALTGLDVQVGEDTHRLVWVDEDGKVLSDEAVQANPSLKAGMQIRITKADGSIALEEGSADNVAIMLNALQGTELLEHVNMSRAMGLYQEAQEEHRQQQEQAQKEIAQEVEKVEQEFREENNTILEDAKKAKEELDAKRKALEEEAKKIQEEQEKKKVELTKLNEEHKKKLEQAQQEDEKKKIIKEKKEQEEKIKKELQEAREAEKEAIKEERKLKALEKEKVKQLEAKQKELLDRLEKRVKEVEQTYLSQQLELAKEIDSKNLRYIPNELTRPVIPSNSQSIIITTELNLPTDSEEDGLMEGARLRDALNFFFASRGNLMVAPTNKEISSDPKVRRWYQFLETHRLTSSSPFRGRLLPIPMSERGEGALESDPHYYIAITDTNGRYLHQDKKGKYVYKDTFDSRTAVFSTVTYVDAADYHKAKASKRIQEKVTEEDFNEAKELFREFLNTYGDGKKLITFNGVSNGIANPEYGLTTRHKGPVSEFYNTNDIEVVTYTGKSTEIRLHNGEKITITPKEDKIYVVDKASGNVHIAEMNTPPLAVYFQLFESLIPHIDHRGVIQLNPHTQKVVDFLLGTTYYTRNNKAANGDPLIKDPSFMFYNKGTNAMLKTFVIGGQEIELAIQGADGKFKINPDFLRALEDFLSLPMIRPNFRVNTEGSFYGFTHEKGGLVSIKHGSLKEYFLSNILAIAAPINYNTDNIGGDSFIRPKGLNRYVRFEYGNIVRDIQNNKKTTKKEQEASSQKSKIDKSTTQNTPFIDKTRGGKVQLAIGTETATVALTRSKGDWTLKHIKTEGKDSLLDSVDFIKWLNRNGFNLLTAIQQQVKEQGTTTIPIGIENITITKSDTFNNVITKLIEAGVIAYGISLQQNEKTSDTSTTPTTTTDTVDNTTASTTNNSRVGIVGAIEDANEFQFRIIKNAQSVEDFEDAGEMRQYLHRRFKGKISLEILDGFSNIGQQGAFIGRTIQLLRNAEKGTVYHEEFHVIFDHVFGKAKQNKLINALLNSPEFASYLDEVGALYGITDKKQQAREALAELYRDFMLGKVSNELTNNSLWKTIVEFFKDLLALMGLANMVYNTTDYKRILLKEFSKVKNTESFNLDNSLESTPQYRIGTLNSYRVSDALKGMHFFMVDYLRAHPLGLQALLTNSPQNAAAVQEALGHTKQQVIDALNLALSTIERAKAAIPEATATNDKPRLDFIYSSIARFEQQTNLLNELLQNWAVSATGVSAIQAYTSYLSDIGIDISKNVDYNVVEDLNENEVKHNAQYIDKGTIDYKKLLDKELKLLLSGIPETSKGGGILFNMMGLPSTYDYNTLYDKLLGKLKNITSDTSLQDIAKAIERIAISNPEFKQLIEPIQLKGTQDRLFTDRKAPEPRLPLLKAIEAHKNPNAKQLTLLEANFLAKFIQTFSKSYNIGIYTIVNNDGKVAVVDPIKSSIRSTLTNSWTTATLQHMEEAKKKNKQPFYTLNEKGERVYLDKPGLAAHIEKRVKDEAALKEAPSIVPSVRSIYILLKELGMPVPVYMLENVFVNNPNAFSKIGERLQIIINSFGKNGTPSLEFFQEHILLSALVNHSAPITHSSRINLNGDRVFNYGQHSFVTNTFNKLRQAPTGNREDLINYLDQKLPHLVAIAERGSSVILKELERVDLNIRYGDNEGMRGADGNTTKTYNRLSDSDRIAAKYELERLGNYEFLRPSDSAQNKIISIDRHFAEDVSLKQFIDEVFNGIFIPYIKDDLATIGDLDNKFKNATKNSSSFNRLLFSMLYSEDMFEYEGNPQSIAEKKEAAKTKKIVRYSTPDGIMGREQFVESFLEHHKERILNNFYLYIKNEEEKRLQELLKHNLVTKEDDGTYTAHIRVADRRNHKPMLPPSATNINTEHLDTGTVTKKELMDGIRFFMVNKWIMDTEQIKLIYGDIKHYKDLATAIKRFKAAFGTKAITVTSTWMNDLVNKLHKKIGNQEHLYDDHGRPLIRTAIVNDVVTVSDYAYEHAQVLDKDNPVFIKLQEKYRDLVNEELVEEDKDSITELDIKQLKSEYPALYINLIQELRKNKSQLRSQPYLEMDETDGFSVISLDEYKTLRLRTGEWDNESEKLYQWERQIYEKVPVSTRVFVDPYTGESVPLKEKDLGIHTFPSLKPHYAGPLALGVGEGFVPSIYKTSAMVLLPSVAEAFPRLGKIHDTLIENNIGLLSFYSANKGADTLTQDGKVNDLYDSEGAVVTELPLTQDIYYEYMGIQLETGNKLKQKTIVATQPTKQILNGKFEYGRVSSKFKSPDSVQAIVDKFLEANAKRLFLGKKMALHHLGLVSKNDRIVVDNVDKFAKHVIKAAEGRAENVKNSIRILIDNLKKGNDVDLEKYAGYKQVESIILSTLNNNMIKQKRQGMAAYQVPSTLFEKNNRVLYDKGTYKSNDLEVSRNENGQITSMEVYLPAYMEELVDGKNDITELLDIVGFRVPTQYVSSIELIKIKGFLPKQAGNIVVMPTEIVGKAGSDFDIDKLYMYMKNTYKKDGKLAVHNEDNWEQEFNSNLQNVVEQIIKDEAPELLEGTMAKYTKSLYDGIATVEDFITHLETSLKSLAKHELTAEPRYIIETLLNLTDSFESAKDAFHLAAIENTWLEAQLELLRLPEASEDLLNPIQTKDLRAIADEVNKIKENPYGYDMDIPTTFIYNESYLNNLNRSLIEGTYNIGPTALVSTFHVLAQLNDLKIRGTINLPVNIDNAGSILLGGLTTVEGNYSIGDILNQVLSGGVDVVKEPWAVDLGITTATLSLFTTMVIMGVSPKTASFFLHHPVVQKYLQMKNSSQGLVKKELVDNMHKGDLDILRYLKDRVGTERADHLLNEQILKNELIKGPRATQYNAAVLNALGKLLNFSTIITDTILKTNPDTDGGGSSLGQVIINVTKGVSLLGNEAHPITNIRNLYSKNGFLNPYYSNTYDIFRIIKELSVVKAEPGFFKISGPLLSLVHQLFTGGGTNAQRISSIANRMITDTATKLLVTNPITLPKTGDEIILNEFREYFMRGNNSFAKFWATLADTPLGKTMLIFQKIKPILNDDTGYHFLKNESGELLKNELDAVTTDWANLSTILYEAPNGLKIDAGTMLLLQFLTQSGLTLTVNSALQYAPADLYNSIIGPAFEAAKFAEQDTSFISKLRFIINNVHDTLLMGHGYGRTSGFAFHKKFKPQYAQLTNLEKAALRSKGTILHTATGYLSVQLGNLATITDENGEGIQVPHNSVIEGRALTTFGTEVERKILEELNTNNRFASNKNTSKFGYMITQGIEEKFESTLKEITKNNTMRNPALQRDENAEYLGATMEDFVDHAGGANGYDTEWHLIGTEFGVKEFKHYLLPVDGEVANKELRDLGVKPTDATADVGPVSSSGPAAGEAQQAVTEAERIMGRIDPTHVTRNTKKIRNYAQVKNADGVFAIGALIPKGASITIARGKETRQALVPQVNGGTSVAVQLGIMMGKPTYVFNQEGNEAYPQGWYIWSDSDKDFTPTDTPILTKHFAGVGTSSNTTEQGKQAIRDVYTKTAEFLKSTQVTSQSRVVDIDNAAKTPTPQPKGTINVYWAQNESPTSTKVLSNLAPRRFTWEGREYGSVEHAYQSNKSGTFDQTTYDAYLKGGNEETPNAKGKMTFAYGNNKRSDVVSNTTFEAIKNGERTATTRYESDGHIDYWKNLKIGDTIEWEASTGEKITVEVTKPLHKLVGSGKTAEQWSKLEGWSVDYFNSKVKPKLNEAWQIEYKFINNNSIDNAYGKKIKGKGSVAEMKAADSLSLMKKLVVESFKQNPNSEAAKKLLQYENFTHNTNELIDQAFLEGLKLAQRELLSQANTAFVSYENSDFSKNSSQSNVQYQLPQGREIEEFVASEKTIRDLAARMADRIGIPTRFESDRSKKYKGKLEGNTAVINLAYATLDTPIHEILGHPIIRAIKNNGLSTYQVPNGEWEIFDNRKNSSQTTTGIFFKTEQEANNYIKSQQAILYQNLLKELETGKGKEVFDRIKEDYSSKMEDFNNIKFNRGGYEFEKRGDKYYKYHLNDPFGAGFPIEDSEFYDAARKEGIRTAPYTLEEQQEEALVELLGLMTAGKIKEGKLLKLLKQLWKEISAFMRDLLRQHEVEVDKLPDNMTLGDIADLLAYSNPKLILPGYEVVYTTPDNQQFKTYQEASNHISDLAKSVGDVDLSGISLEHKLSQEDLQKIEELENQKKEKEDYFGSKKYQQDKDSELYKLNKKLEELKNKKVEFYSQEPSLDLEDKEKYGFQNFDYIRVESTYARGNEYHKDILGENYEGYYIHGYNTSIGKPKSKILPITKEQAINIWEKDEDSKYEAEDRQEIFRAENSIRYLQEDAKIKYEISSIEREIRNIKVGQNTMQSFIDKNKEYEQSKEIIEEWKKANNIQYNPEEVYSRGQEFVSVVGAYSDFDVDLMMQNLLQHIEDNQKAGGEFTISAFTKPIDKQISHLEGGGGKLKFKIYPKSKDIKWAASTDVYSGSVWDASAKVSKDKKSELLGVSYTKYPSLQNVGAVQPNLASIIDSLAHHHNELGVSLTGANFRVEYDEDIPYTTKKIIDSINSILDEKYGKLVKPEISQPKTEKITLYRVKGEPEYFNTREEAQQLANKLSQIDYMSTYVVETINVDRVAKQTGIQPTQTNETLKESIESIKNKIIQDLRLIKSGDFWVVIAESTRKIHISTENKQEAENYINKFSKTKEKEYTEQALINIKIAKLKEVAKKYPRSLIRSEVRRITTQGENSLFNPNESLSQKVPGNSAVEGYLAVFEPEQIHILGSKQDTEGSRNWIDGRNNFDKELAQKIQDKLQRLYPEIKLNITNNPIWEQGDNIFNQEEYNNQVNYKLKATEKILDNLTKIKQWENNKSIDTNTLWKKIGELGIPKQQLDLLKESRGSTVEEKLTSFVANYSYSVEINTAKTNEEKQVKQFGDNEEFTFAGSIYEYKNNEYLKDGDIIDLIEYETAKNDAFINPNTSYYSNLTVPGGTNYTEKEIATPLITPSIKEHAEFATDNGIGWVRSDELTSLEVNDRIERGEPINVFEELAKSAKQLKTRRILEIQSDLFQKGRDLDDLVTKQSKSSLDHFSTLMSNLNRKLDKDEISLADYRKERQILENNQKLGEKFRNLPDNQFLQLLNKNNNWVTFFIKSIIQDSAKKGYEKVLFPKGDTSIKIESPGTGINTIDEAKAQNQDALASTGLFYEIKVGNILEKQFGKDNVKTITDEFGNQWREITINQARDLDNILLQKNEADRIIGQANIKAMTVLIDAINQKQDTLPHEYAHHYIAWYRDTSIVQEAIKKWGSEEALVQSIGEQVVKQEGEAYNWWNNFVEWIMSKFNSLSKLQKEELTQILTDAFLTRQDLKQSNQQSPDIANTDLNTNFVEDSYTADKKQIDRVVQQEFENTLREQAEQC